MRSTLRTRRTVALAASGLAVAALIAGCGSSGGSYGGSSGGSGGPSAPAAGVTLRTAQDPKLGTIVTDAAGFTLYRFDQDRNSPPESSCNGSCAVVWPPEHADGGVTVKGIDGKLVGTVTRADGTAQVTLNGWPAYRYAPDTKPGDTKGQGVGGTWFALTPSGGRAGAAGGTAPSPANPGPMPGTPMPGNPTPGNPMPGTPGY
ncbi:hypothetical protein ABZW03_15590 [Kitasatospora sp. NPDC004799]|uniref:hypothetical protein n=1 Tax=Kitasatospora sp. NPDC004799 TaxID=3154460 RepID=UPI0033A6F95B